VRKSIGGWYAVAGENVLGRAHVVTHIHIRYVEKRAKKSEQCQTCCQKPRRAIKRFQILHASWPSRYIGLRVAPQEMIGE
jgi:hypothetical protein